MAKLSFRYATMASGKSAEILQVDFNYKLQNFKGLLLIPSIDTTSDGAIKSRLGISAPAFPIDTKTNIYELIVNKLKDTEIEYVIVDESNFLTQKQCDELGDIVDFLNIDVLAYGILTDFKTQLFEGSKRLIEISDNIENIYVRSICHCGKKAVHNARIVNGKWAEDGAQTVIDKKDGNKNEVTYIPLCRKCFKLKKIK